MFRASKHSFFAFQFTKKLILFFWFHHHFDNITLICYFFQC